MRLCSVPSAERVRGGFWRRRYSSEPIVAKAVLAVAVADGASFALKHCLAAGGFEVSLGSADFTTGEYKQVGERAFYAGTPQIQCSQTLLACLSVVLSVGRELADGQVRNASR